MDGTVQRRASVANAQAGTCCWPVAFRRLSSQVRLGSASFGSAWFGFGRTVLMPPAGSIPPDEELDQALHWPRIGRNRLHRTAHRPEIPSLAAAWAPTARLLPHPINGFQPKKSGRNRPKSAVFPENLANRALCPCYRVDFSPKRGFRGPSIPPFRLPMLQDFTCLVDELDGDP